jgi:hypothetical protein
MYSILFRQQLFGQSLVAPHEGLDAGMLIFQSQIVRPRKQIRPFEYQYQLNQEQRGLALDTFWKRFQNES